MKVLAAYCLHYGAEYLSYSIRSVLPCVDEVAVFYSPIPSHGHGTELTCPESEQLLRDIAEEAAGEKKFTWHKSAMWGTEGEHRGAMLRYAEEHDYDIMLTVDADEVWNQGALEVALIQTDNDICGPVSRLTVPMRHLWQGFDLVCDDPCRPVRVHHLKRTHGEGHLEIPVPVWHFGYAISDEVMAYKWQIHGHKDELRKNWYREKWLAHATEDVHPGNEKFWDAKPLDRNLLPEIMRKHPRWNG